MKLKQKVKITPLLISILLIFIIGCNNSPKKSGNSDMTSYQNNNQLEYKVTFIELGSVNCIPCKMMQPIMKEIENEYGDQVKVVFHDVWTEQGSPFASKYQIRVIPTQVFLDAEGKEYFRHEGFFPKEELVKILNQKGVK